MDVKVYGGHLPPMGLFFRGIGDQTHPWRPMNRNRQALPEEAQPLEIPAAVLDAPLDWDTLFGRPGRHAIEIGTGNGYFLADEAQREPDFNFIGFEREPVFYRKMVKRCARRGLANVRTLCTDAVELLPGWVPDASLDRLYCLFSDPWPKRRHRDRRVFSEQMPPLLARLLAPGGEVRFKTDVGFYFNLAVTVFREHGGWRFLEIGELPPPDVARGETLSNFERKAREAGSEVWGFTASRA